MQAADAGAYDRYVRAEWASFAADPDRGLTAREAVAGLSISRVLDIGCGAGQELRPFVGGGRSLGVGIDVAPDVGAAGRELFAQEQPGSRVAYVRAEAEHLPFHTSSFDLILSRLALPYTDNARAFAEMARVLRPGGAVLLKYHHGRYYLDKLRDALAARHFKSAVHACRVLAAGAVYHATGTQPRGRLTGRETFQTDWLLRRELRRHGLEIVQVLRDSRPAAPSLLIRRSAEQREGAARSQGPAAGSHAVRGAR